jgi:ParB family chromosome partitioning protein
MELEFHQLDLRYEALRVRRAEVERRLLGSLSESGQQVPIVVVALSDEPGRYVVIDGHKRIRALRRLGRDTVEAMVWPVSEAQALVADGAQRQSSALSALEQGWLLHELSERHGLSGEELARRLGRSASWVSRHLGLVRELPAAVQEQVRAGRLPAQAVMKYLLPLFRVRAEDAEALVAAAVRLHLGSRDIAELCRAWQSGGEAVRARLVSQPELFLRTRRELCSPDPRPETTVEKVRRDLDLVGVLVRRSTRALRAEPGAVKADERDLLRSLARQAEADLRQLQRQLEEMDPAHAERTSTHDDPGAVRPGDEPAPDRPDAEAVAQGGQSGDCFRLDAGPARAARQPRGRAPHADPRAVHVLPGQPGPGP